MNTLNTKAVALAINLVNGASLSYVDKGYTQHDMTTQRYVTFSLGLVDVVDYYTMLTTESATGHDIFLDNEDNITCYTVGTRGSLNNLKANWVPFPVFYKLFKSAITVTPSGLGRDFYTDINELTENKGYATNANLFVTTRKSIIIDLVELKSLLECEYGQIVPTGKYVPETNEVVYQTK